MEIDAPYRSLHHGEMLNWYRIERILGRGGFGVIYLATDTNLDHLVAIKEYRVLVPSGRDDTHSGTRERQARANEGVHRFIAEARNLVRFKHPNIVRVMSVFELNETAYMVMEFEEGQDLRKYLDDPINAHEAALKRLFVPISKGLAEVHKHGFIHRDIKPANILVRKDGTPVLLDFGSARSSGIAGPETLTALVSAGYAPLEQYSMGSEREQGPWTDIYALGAVLYFAVTGVEPVDSAKRASALLNGGQDPLLAARMVGHQHYTKEFLGAIDWALQLRIADRPQTLTRWMTALLSEPISSRITRRVDNATGQAGQAAVSRAWLPDPLRGLSMRNQPAPHEVQAARARRKIIRRPNRRPRWWGLAVFVAVATVAAMLIQAITARQPALQQDTSGNELRERTTATVDGVPAVELASPRKEPAASEDAASIAAREKEQAIALEQEARVARENAAAARDAAAEKARIATLESERRERLQVRRVQLENALSQATLQLDQGQLDEAQDSLDEAAALDRNDATLKALRSRWRSALIDARTPVSDRDFDRVIEKFDQLRRALENNDVATMESLTTPSNQNALFRQLMSNFSRLDISINQIRVRNADKSISATLRIESMIRDNGDRATPSPAYRERAISSRRSEGEWSAIQW